VRIDRDPGCVAFFFKNFRIGFYRMENEWIEEKLPHIFGCVRFHIGRVERHY
jgi:hypothetical protein